MSPNRTAAKLSTERDAAAERAIIDEWYGSEVYVKRLATFASADYLIATLDQRYVVECKDRSRYHQRYMVQNGYVIGVGKLQRVIALAQRHDAQPVLLVRWRIGHGSDTAIVRMDPRALDEGAPREMFRRERGRETRRDIAEEAVNVGPTYWEEWRSPTYRWVAQCLGCGNGPDGRFPDGSPSFRCHHE